MILILRNSRFRLLWPSTLLNDAGMLTHLAIQGWLALIVTDSAFWVGAAAICLL